MAAQYPVPVLLDSRGNPFSTNPQDGYDPSQASPQGAWLPQGGQYGPTLILVEPGGGQIKLTDQDDLFRAMPYADVHASQAAIATVVGGMLRRLAMVPRKVYRRPAKGATQNGRPKMPEHDEDNSLHDLLCRPAPGFGRMSLTEWQALSFLVNGNSLLVKFRGNGVGTAPTEIFPLDWRFAQAWARIGTPVIAWGTVQTGDWVWIKPSEVCHTMWASVAGPNGAWLGTSPLAQLGVTIKIDEAAASFAASRFNNQMRPGGVATLPADIDVRQVENITTRVQAALDAAYKGTDKAFKNVVLAGGTTLAPWPSQSDEAQLVNTREYDSVEVCGVFGQPWDAYFGRSGATPENEGQVWKALWPWANAMDDRLQAQLVDPEPEWDGLFVKSDFDEILFSDPLVLSDKMSTEYEVGLRTLNEARYPLGLGPVPNGDLFAAEQMAMDPQLGPDGKPIPPAEQQLTTARTAVAFERL